MSAFPSHVQTVMNRVTVQQLCVHLICLSLREGKNVCTLSSHSDVPFWREGETFLIANNPRSVRVVQTQCSSHHYALLCVDHRDQLAITFPQNPYISCFIRTSRLIPESHPIGKRSWLLKHKKKWEVGYCSVQNYRK